MKNRNNHKSRRIFPDRFKSFGCLPDHRSLFIICSLLVLFVPSFLVGSCEKASSRDGKEPPAEAVQDSVDVTVAADFGSRNAKWMDIFVYKADGSLSPLEKHVRVDAPGAGTKLRLCEGKKILTAIVNSPKRFNTAALSKHELVGQIEYGFSEDDFSAPIMGAEAEFSWISKRQDGIFESGSNPEEVPERKEEMHVEIAPRPIMCEVVIESVSNTMDDYELLESPRLRLCSMNAKARLFTDKPEIPSELIDKGEWKSLPYDVGFFPQKPGITLYCYPNETAEDEVSFNRTAIELECLIKGKKCSFRMDLPPLKRGTRITVGIVIDGPGESRADVLQSSREQDCVTSETCSPSSGKGPWKRVRHRPSHRKVGRHIDTTADA